MVGKRLAKRLGMRFVDIDDLIVQREGRTIAKIFAQEGEPYFRKVEKGIALEVCSRENCVIATGGGTLLDPENRSLLKKTGRLIWLKVSADTVLERVKDSPLRPLIKTENPRERIVSLLALREPSYAQADITVSTDTLSVEQVVEVIIARLSQFR